MADQDDSVPPASDNGRREAMALFARATHRELSNGLAAAGCTTECTDLRPPDVGLVMARGRISGSGRPFNVGEVTVTRAAVKLDGGMRGFAYLMGREPERARLAAIADAHWQTAAKRDAIDRFIVAPVRTRLESERQRRRDEAAATQVEFFTMVRGDG